MVAQGRELFFRVEVPHIFILWDREFVLLHHTFERQVESHKNKVALVCGERRYTYSELADRVQRLAATLQQRGVRRGDRVAIFLDNTMEAVISLYAALKVGGIFMLINPLTKRDKLAYVLHDAAPVCLISDARLHAAHEAAVTQTESIHTLVLAGLPAPGGSWNGKGISFEQSMSTPPTLEEAGTIDQDLAAIIYTSGSTGHPKGVMLSHRNMLSAADSVSSYLGLRQDDIILCALPLAFDYGLYQILLGFNAGARVILERSFAFPAKILEIMAHEQVAVFPGVPTMFSLIISMGSVARHDLHALRLVTNTAAALSERHIHEIRRLFPQAKLFSMYGLTECKRVSYLPPEELDRRPASVGRGMPNQEIYLVDEQGQRLALGSTGELVIRGSHVMRGYWRKPAETAQRLKPGPYPGESVLYSGDIFRTDSEGYLYFIGRGDDVIKSRGEKVSPKEVENVLYSLSGVLEAAVVGVPDALLGQAVKAFIVLRPDFHYSEREVVKYCLAHLENYMAPKYVEFVAALPQTGTGKISKQQLLAEGELRNL